MPSPNIEKPFNYNEENVITFESFRNIPSDDEQ